MLEFGSHWLDFLVRIPIPSSTTTSSTTTSSSARSPRSTSNKAAVYGSRWACRCETVGSPSSSWFTRKASLSLIDSGISPNFCKG
eukprot:2738185-Rhodomonas_salina.2